MNVSDIPIALPYERFRFDLQKLLIRAQGPERANWLDLPTQPGIYVVCLPVSEQPIFQAHAGNAQYANTVDRKRLQSKWNCLCQPESTDIIYIGKGNNLRKRIRDLARFGVGRADNHHGGEWMWQISNITSCELIIQMCPPGKQIAFENKLLEMFCNVHGDFPLANREGPEGAGRWP